MRALAQMQGCPQVPRLTLSEFGVWVGLGHQRILRAPAKVFSLRVVSSPKPTAFTKLSRIDICSVAVS